MWAERNRGQAASGRAKPAEDVHDHAHVRGEAWLFSSRLGGGRDDAGRVISRDLVGNIYIAGVTTHSATFPVPQGQTEGKEIFVARLTLDPTPPRFTGIDPDTGAAADDEITQATQFRLAGETLPGRGNPGLRSPSR